VVELLADVLRRNKGLRSINLSGNSLLTDATLETDTIWYKAAKSLLSAFREHPLLSSVTGQVSLRQSSVEKICIHWQNFQLIQRNPVPSPSLVDYFEQLINNNNNSIGIQQAKGSSLTMSQK